ncbi:MAG: trypsin-like peptidase domain-containing protein, partial [Planctomycetota bacterium]
MTERRQASVWVSIIAILGVLTLQPAKAAGRQTNWVKGVVETVQPAFVFIGGGSGVVISPDGYILTNAHVIRNQEEVRVRLGTGDSHKAVLVGVSRQGDIALLKIEDGSNLAHLRLADSANMPVGTQCLAMGNPLALGIIDHEPTVTTGVISTKNLYRDQYNDAIVTDAAVNPGNSGGPLVNMSGGIVGIIGQIETRWGLRANTGIGLAVLSNQIKRWLPRLKNADGGNVQRGHIPGIQWSSMRAEKTGGAPIKGVAKGSPAEEAGLESGDVIKAAGGKSVWNVPRLQGVLKGYPAGDRIVLEIDRDEENVTLQLQLTTPPQPGFQLNIDEKDGEKVVVESVTKNSAAEQAGLKEGDVVIAVGEQRLEGSSHHRRIT